MKLNDILIFLDDSKLTKMGQNYVMLCPFHEEKTPSFIMVLAKNEYQCVGCSKKGRLSDLSANLGKKRK